MNAKSILKYVSICLSILSFLLLSIYFSQASENDLVEIIFFDIGQGDAILIRTISGNKVLIDGGPENYLIGQIGKELTFYDKFIDLVILTHAHDDHVSGLNEILQRYEVGQVLFPGLVDYYEPAYKEWLSIIEQKDINLQATKAGEVYKFDDGSYLEILYPFVSYQGELVEDVNDTSVISRFCYVEVCVLLTGDATAQVEEELLISGQDLSAEILKLGHHGSQYSSSEEFLVAVDPEVAVIQSGVGNSFNHPHLRILKRLARLGIEVLRNDQLGQIVIQTDGYDWWLK